MKVEAFITWTDDERELVRAGFAYWDLLFDPRGTAGQEQSIELINVTLGQTETHSRLAVSRIYAELVRPDARLAEEFLHRAGLIMAMINTVRSEQQTAVALAMIFGAEVVVQQCNQLVAMHSTPSLMSAENN